MHPSNLRHRAVILAGFSVLVLVLLASIVVDIPYVNVEGFLLVVGGTYLSGLVSYGYHDLHFALEAAYSIKPFPRHFLLERIQFFSKISKTFKSEGRVSLEKIAQAEGSPILKKGLQLIADGVSYQELKDTVSLEYSLTKEQRSKGVEIILQLANVAPAAGLIGTVVGLVSMLANVENAEDLSSGMSIALLTTLYGAVLSYLVLQPLATRLRAIIESREKLYMLQLEGLLALGQEMSPQLIEERLDAFAA